jgi:hypothetical protein
MIFARFESFPIYFILTVLLFGKNQPYAYHIKLKFACKNKTIFRQFGVYANFKGRILKFGVLNSFERKFLYCGVYANFKGRILKNLEF